MKRFTLISLVMALILITTGCVTETMDGPFRKADKQKILESQIRLGVGYLRNRNYQLAKENLQKALDVDPKSAEAHNYFGLLYQLELDPEMAEEHYKKAIHYDPDYAAARNNYGAFLFEQGRYKEAVDQLKHAVQDKLYRNRPQVYENLGIGYLKLNDPADAEDAFTKAVALNPNQARALLELAEMRFQERNYVKARGFYDRYKRVANQSARSLWLGIQLARIFGDKDEEASLALALKNIFPASPEYKAYKRSLQQ